MTFQTFKRFVLMSVFFMTTSVVIYVHNAGTYRTVAC